MIKRNMGRGGTIMPRRGRIYELDVRVRQIYELNDSHIVGV